ncbi:hypothetical protein GNZ12_26715 [Paraburkholderia sp. 1N]|uniref:Uncharacterized protein n=1 Tax=Paraburkholderia solitsugae TaxID=2675748 RepID=A0ABX2BY43_9BURK|nr:hypothetical protein [Paraburkholderia solitsugae]NPT44845.1 hypothetical protein [Paraburkholderia solitsugae]
MGDIVEDWIPVKTAMLAGPLLDLTLAKWSGDFSLVVVQLYAGLHPAYVLVQDNETATETDSERTLRPWNPQADPELAAQLVRRLNAEGVPTERAEGDDMRAALCRALTNAVGPVVAVPVYSHVGDKVPDVDTVRALDERIFATLSADERAVLNFYRTRGRKFGAYITITGDVDETALAAGASPLQEDAILRRSSRVHVSMTDEMGAGNGVVALSVQNMAVAARRAARSKARPLGSFRAISNSAST